MRSWFAVLVVAACEREVAKPKPTPTPTPTPVVSVTPDAGTPVTRALRSKELFDRPDLIGKEVDVEMYEKMLDSKHSSVANPGELDVEVVDVGGSRLEIAWADHKPLKMSDIEIPVRVHATLRKGRGLRLEATKIEHFPFPPPVKIDKPSDILTDPKKFSGTLVTFEADWFVGFEASYIDKLIWMDGMPGLKEICAPPPPKDDQRFSRSFRVRVIGLAYTAGQYGHRNRSNGLILAREIAYLDPKRPDCR
ncbi:MAG: hypothetical protein H0V17_27340 [Deltaproteobacteria bacterium]|nr:hypothetical protein [Deltaproteobacteria bacterium]